MTRLYVQIWYRGVDQVGMTVTTYSERHVMRSWDREVEVEVEIPPLPDDAPTGEKIRKKAAEASGDATP